MFTHITVGWGRDLVQSLCSQPKFYIWLCSSTSCFFISRNVDPFCAYHEILRTHLKPVRKEADFLLPIQLLVFHIRAGHLKQVLACKLRASKTEHSGRVATCWSRLFRYAPAIVKTRHTTHKNSYSGVFFFLTFPELFKSANCRLQIINLVVTNVETLQNLHRINTLNVFKLLDCCPEALEVLQ